MYSVCRWSLLLCFLSLNCGDNLQAATVVPTTVVATVQNTASAEVQGYRWPHPEQERWVDEPVFNGKLHLVNGGLLNHQTIVLIHGLGNQGMLDWARVFPELIGRYHVIAIDLPGFGSSDGHQVQYAPAEYARLVSWVVSQYAHGPVIVIGHSMGAAVSLRYAHNYPEQVSRLIMVDCAAVLQRTVFVKNLAKTPVTYKWLTPYQSTIPGLDRLVRKVARNADSWTRSLLVTADRMPDIPQLLMSNSLAQKYLYKDRATMNAALGLVYEDFSAAVREVDVPTHIIWGELDNVAPLRTGVVMANIMSDAELHVIRGAGHAPMMDSFEDFMLVLTNSLQNAPYARQSKKRIEVIERGNYVEEVTLCEGQSDRLYTGHYGVLRIRNCNGIVLRDLVAESIELIGSEVLLENVKLHSPGIGLSVTDSMVVASLLQIEANIGMMVDNSYLDIAGADFINHEKLIEIRTDSQLYFSLSESRQGDLKQALHGVSLGPVLNVH